MSRSGGRLPGTPGMRFSLHRERRGQLPPGTKDAYVESPSAQGESEGLYRGQGQDNASLLTRQERFIRRRQLRLDRAAKRRALKKGTQVELVRRQDIIERDKSTCYLCGRVLEQHEIEIDHVIPLAGGGTHTADNMKVSCAPCNRYKGATMPSD